MIFRVLFLITVLVAIMLRMFRVVYIKFRRLFEMLCKSHFFLLGIFLGWQVSQFMGVVQSW